MTSLSVSAIGADAAVMVARSLLGSAQRTATVIDGQSQMAHIRVEQRRQVLETALARESRPVSGTPEPNQLLVKLEHAVPRDNSLIPPEPQRTGNQLNVAA